ncbi:DUF948 domain-containing protein [Bogoriella caseilytica]|uniref:Uncharacterized protein DUF948 n=1 Tax=Bogoriella caseilytica TaxID=56055 RepID=A0A3N2B999_9MICO|nr:DUF948 domain-containing protein [Bogoriella caseilytica]ROR71712.1 uncharacterized protein DUF948 [Bogoriella caseilytica]
MSIGDIAGLIAAIAFVILVLALAVPLVKLGRVLDEARGTVRRITDHTLPAIDETVLTIKSTNEQLAKVDTVTTSAARVTEDVSALTTLVSATVGGPLIKVSAFSHAVRATFRGFKHRPDGGRRSHAKDAYHQRESDLRAALLIDDGPTPAP